MTWYIRTINTSGGVAYKTEEEAVDQVRATLKVQEGRGYRISEESGRKVIRDGHDLINSMWVEDEDGHVVPFSYPG